MYDENLKAAKKIVEDFKHLAINFEDNIDEILDYLTTVISVMAFNGAIEMHQINCVAQLIEGELNLFSGYSNILASKVRANIREMTG